MGAGHGLRVICLGVSPVDVHTLSGIEASTNDLTQKSGSDLDALFGHQFNNFGHVTKILFIGLEALEHSLHPTWASNHQVLAGLTIWGRSMNGSRLDEISATGGNDGGLTIHIEVQRTLEHDIGLIPVMRMRRLTNTTRCFEFGNAVLAIGLISRQTQGDAVAEHIADLRLVAGKSEHVMDQKGSKNLCPFLTIS